MSSKLQLHYAFQSDLPRLVPQYVCAAHVTTVMETTGNPSVTVAEGVSGVTGGGPAREKRDGGE